MNNIFEKNSLTLILLKIFDIYLGHNFATNKKIAITHLWHAMGLQTTVNDLFSAQCAKQSLFLFNICWEKMSLLAHPS